MKIEMIKVDHSEVMVGDKIMPPVREVNLWMKRDCLQKGLPLEALLLKVIAVKQNYKKDKGGEWTRFYALYSKEFGNEQEIRFNMRPTTKVEKAIVKESLTVQSYKENYKEFVAAIGGKLILLKQI